MRNSDKWALASWAAIACGLAAMPTAAQAQADDGASQERTNVIVVTSRKRQENLTDVPLPVTVATKEQLDRDQIYNMNDLQRITPALEISQTSGGESNGGGRLRGVGTGVFNSSVASSVAFVIDQVPIGNLSFPQLFDLAQIEVLRGPQGTLFGQGASAGVINVTTGTPSVDGISGSVNVDWADKGTAGSEVGEFTVNGAVNLPLGSQWAVRIASQYKNETGLQRSVTTGEDNSIEDWGVRGRLLFQPSDQFSALFSVENAKNTSDGQTFFAIAVAPNSTTPFDPDGPGPAPAGGPIGAVATGAYAGCGVTTISQRAEFYCEDAPSLLETSIQAYSAILDLELSDAVSIASVTSFRDRNSKTFSRDFSRLAGGPAARSERVQNDSRGFSQELRLTYASDSVDLVGGVYYTDFHTEGSPLGDPPYNFGSNLPGERIGFSVCTFAGTFCPVPTSFSTEVTENRTLAGFVDATVRLSDQFSVFGGLRLDDYKNTTATGSNALTPSTSFETTDSNISGRIGVSFQPNGDTNFYASYSRGYKPPAVGTNPAGALFELDPEKTNSFELGAKAAVGRVQLAGNLFYTELLDFQSQTSVFVGTALVSQPLNVDRIESYGFELNAFGRVFEGFNVNAGYQFNEITFPTGYVGDGGGNLGGTQFLNAPKHKFTLSGDYGFPVSNDIELFVNANLVYKSKVLLASRADPRYRYPAHEMINGGFGIRSVDGNWTASVFVRNLTKEREPTAMLANTFAGQIDGGIRYWPVAGLTARVVGVRAGINF